MTLRRKTFFAVLSVCLMTASLLLSQEKSVGDDRTLRPALGDSPHGNEAVAVGSAKIISARTDRPIPLEKMSEARDGRRLERLRKRIEEVISRAEGEVGVALKHLESGQALGFNAEVSFPMASTFKLPLLVEVMAQVKAGSFSLDDEVSVQKTDQHLGSGILSSLAAPGIRLSVRNLVNLMMMVSDNSATDMLLAKVNAENINKRLKQHEIVGIRTLSLKPRMWRGSLPRSAGWLMISFPSPRTLADVAAGKNSGDSDDGPGNSQGPRARWLIFSGECAVCRPAPS